MNIDKKVDCTIKANTSLYKLQPAIEKFLCTDKKVYYQGKHSLLKLLYSVQPAIKKYEPCLVFTIKGNPTQKAMTNVNQVTKHTLHYSLQ